MSKWHMVVEGLRVLAIVVAAVATALAGLTGDATLLGGAALAVGAAAVPPAS
ncbi:MAG: hypothetical protein H3C50_11875 [Kiritimatiellae bacterium]|nr:hypothetical protein [Kiritimatiellia bacterium]